jgi:hypothetical protein
MIERDVNRVLQTAHRHFTASSKDVWIFRRLPAMGVVVPQPSYVAVFMHSTNLLRWSSRCGRRTSDPIQAHQVAIQY